MNKAITLSITRLLQGFFVVTLINLISVLPVSAKNLYSYVLLGPNNQSIVRVIVDSDTCPTLTSGSSRYPMRLRVQPENASEQAQHESFFPVGVCELNWPQGATHLSLDQQPLPELPSTIKQIAIVGDTGCRIKAPFSYQGCNDKKEWPLEEVSQSIAQEKPDVLIHVGDYLYRESACMTKGCQGSVHGYGWDSWQEDVFKPMRAVMQATPMVLVRGNHESCRRAGEGWFRFFDPYPFDAQRACLNRSVSIISQPYAITLNHSLEWIVFDSAEVQEMHPSLNQAELKQNIEQVRGLLEPHYHHWLLIHHPSLGYGYGKLTGWFGGTTAIFNLFNEEGQQPSPLSQFDFFVQGHIHTFEITNYQEKGLPINIVSGMGGTQLEDAFQQKSLSGYEVEKGVHVKHEVNDQHFGYLMYSEVGPTPTLMVKDVSGKTRETCLINTSQKEFECH